MFSCSRCTALPEPIPEAGILRLAPPVAHTLGNLRGYLDRSGFDYTIPVAGLLEIPLSAGVLGRFIAGLDGILGREELRDTKSLIVSSTGSSLSDLVGMQPLSTLVARVQGDWFTMMLRERRLTSHFHPIVATRDPSQVFAYECLLRGQEPNGSLIAPGLLYRAARESDLLFPLDQAARLTAIRMAAEHGLDAGRTRLFVNFNPSSIYDPAACLRSTVAAVAETAFVPGRIVFEVVESDRVDDLSHLTRILEFYRDAGFKVALDDLGSGFGSLNLLSMLRPDFVKLDMELSRGVDRDPYKASIVRKLLEMAQELGIETVAEGIETEGEWDWVRRHGADYVQGFYFSRPGSPPPVLTRRGQEAGPVPCEVG